MSGYVWSFIAVFMIHEMEEVIGLADWINKNMPMLRKKYPFIADQYSPCSGRGFAAGVYEELILFTAVCLFSELTGNYGAWFAMLAEFTAHLVIHIISAVIVRQYIPAVVTSALMLPPSVFLMLRAIPLIDFSARGTLVALVIFAIAAPINLMAAHMLVKSVTRHYDGV